MKIEMKESKLPGCFELQANKLVDDRGAFVKTFHAPTFRALGLNTEFIEEYYSISDKNVVRGMHFQRPPDDHVKLVYCTSGLVMDVVIDLRKGSPTYGQHVVFELSSDKANMVYIPKGMAHGFCVLSDQATMVYNLSTVYSPECDSGVRWDTAGIDWPVITPIISSRDQDSFSLDEFDSPFTYERKYD